MIDPCLFRASVMSPSLVSSPSLPRWEAQARTVGREARTERRCCACRGHTSSTVMISSQIKWVWDLPLSWRFVHVRANSVCTIFRKYSMIEGHCKTTSANWWSLVSTSEFMLIFMMVSLLMSHPVTEFWILKAEAVGLGEVTGLTC